MKTSISLFLLTFGLVAVCDAAPSLTTYNWVGGSGDYSTAGNWNPQAVPDATSRAFIECKNATPITVTFPAGDHYDTKASQRYNIVSPGTSITLDASATTFRMPSCEVANYEDEPFGFRIGGSHYFNFQTYSDAADVRNKRAICVISNGVWRLTRTSSGGCNVDFDQGFYNFYDPEGTPYSKGYFMMCNSWLTGDVTVTFHEGTRSRTPAWHITHNIGDGYTARVAFLGGQHEIFGPLEVPTNLHYMDNHSGDTVFDVTNNAVLDIKGPVLIGAKTTSATYIVNGKDVDWDSRYFFNVAAGGKLTFEDDLTQQYSGPFFLNAGTGGTIRFDGTATIGPDDSTGTVEVAAGGRIEGKVKLVGSGRSTLEVAAGGVADLDSLIVGSSGSNVTLAVSPDATLQVADFRLARGEIAIPEGGAWMNQAMYLGHSGGLGARMSVPAGAVCSVPETFYTGYTGGGGTLDIAGDVSAGVFGVANDYTTTGEVNMVSGTLTVTNRLLSGGGSATFNLSGGKVSAQVMYFPYAVKTPKDNTYGTFNVTGGQLVVKESLGIGHSAGGELNISGGEVSCMYIFLGQTNNSNEPHGGTLRMTGGKFTTTASDRTDTGVKVADAVNRKGHVILDGGEAYLTRLFGWDGARCRGGNGLATFSADGGTIVARSAVNDLILDFDTAELGAKGLTVRSDYACPISQSFTDKPGAEGSGLLTLTGTGVKTLSPTNSTVSRLAVAGGTVCFVPGVGGVQAKQDSSIVVTNGATLSLVGAQTGLDVRDLTIGDAVSSGRIALDADDVISVSGALVVNDGVIVVGDDFELGREYSFIELAGDRSAELAEAWANIRVVSAGAVNGRGFGVKVQYDETAQKTHIKVQVTDASVTPSVVTWQGPGSDWATGVNWQGGACPTAMDIAAFGAEAAPNAVTIAGAVAAAGLVFDDARGYTLTGDKIVVSSLDAAVIRAEQGTNRVENALSLLGRLPVEVASGAAVDLQGTLRGADLVKTGVGRLVLSGANNELTTVGLSNGTFAAAAPRALGSATVLQTGGTLELGGPADADSRYEQRIVTRLSNPKAPVAWNVTADVTMKTPDFAAGLPYKRGAGRLTLENETALDYLTHNEGNSGDWYFKNATVALDADGQLPADVTFAGFNIAEGEVRLVGDSAEKVMSCRYFLAVGVPQPTAATPPALTIDHVTLDNDLSGRHLLLGSGFTGSNVQINDIYLTATNDASIKANTLYVGRGNTRSNMRYHVLFDKASLSSSYMVQANAGSGAGALAEFVFRNKSALYTPRVNAPYRAKLVFDDSLYAKNAKGDPAEITFDVNFSGVGATSGSDWEFRNGSVLVCNKVDAYGWPQKPTTLTFADSEWRTGAADFAFVYKHPMQVKFYVENDGLILAPPAGGTWTMQNAVAGTGGLVKRGGGTLVFDTPKRVNPDTSAVEPWTSGTTTLDFSGTAKVEEGTLKIVGGASAGTASVELAAGTVLDLAGGTSTLAKVTGAGTIRNGTIACALATADDVSSLPVFDGDTIAFGRLVFDAGDYSEENPYVKSANPVAVARYTGATPTIVGGKSIHTGVPGSLAKFTAENGVIYAQAVYRGMTVNFR